MSGYKVTKSIPVSEPMIFDDDDLRVVISALRYSRKNCGSVRADDIIRKLEYQLAHPDTHVITFQDTIPFA